MWDFLRSASQNQQKTDLKSTRFVPFVANLAQYGSNSDTPVNDTKRLILFYGNCFHLLFKSRLTYDKLFTALNWYFLILGFQGSHNNVLNDNRLDLQFTPNDERCVWLF